MNKKMYVLRTWTIEGFGKHPESLSVYIIDETDENLKNVPYISTSKWSAKKFYTKNEAIKYGKKFSGCYVDCVWHIKRKCRDGQILDLWG